MVIIGTVLFLVGAIAELLDYLRGAWPTAITWILMGLGLLLVAVIGAVVLAKRKFA